MKLSKSVSGGIGLVLVACAFLPGIARANNHTNPPVIIGMSSAKTTSYTIYKGGLSWPLSCGNGGSCSDESVCLLGVCTTPVNARQNVFKKKASAANHCSWFGLRSLGTTFFGKGNLDVSVNDATSILGGQIKFEGANYRMDVKVGQKYAVNEVKVTRKSDGKSCTLKQKSSLKETIGPAELKDFSEVHYRQSEQDSWIDLGDDAIKITTCRLKTKPCEEEQTRVESLP